MSPVEASRRLTDGSNHRRGAPIVTLRDLREQRKVTIRALESATGIHRGRLSELERGIRWPQASEVERLEGYFSVPLVIRVLTVVEPLGGEHE